jgi:uncharacterized lipoprotein YajG
MIIKQEYMRMKRLLIFIICAVILSGCSAQDKKKELNHEALLSGASMNVTSESLVSGRWSDIKSSRREEPFAPAEFQPGNGCFKLLHLYA